jgi:hypothetical protein
LRLQRVHSWQERSGSPGEIETEVVMGDINRPEIPFFVMEKVADIQDMEDKGDNYRVCHKFVVSVLQSNKRKIAV